MHHIVVLFLDALDGLLLNLMRHFFRHRFLRNYLVLLILFIELDLQVVFIRVNLIGKFGFFDDVPNELKIIEKEQELP